MSNFIVGKKYPMRNGKPAELKSIGPDGTLYFNIDSTLTSPFNEDGKFLGLGLFKTHCPYDIISDTPIEEEIKIVPSKLKNLSGGFSPRRQFDVSKGLIVSRKEYIKYNDFYGDCDDRPPSSQHSFIEGIIRERKEVLEAWNEGRIEELLESWVQK